MRVCSDSYGTVVKWRKTDEDISPIRDGHFGDKKVGDTRPQPIVRTQAQRLSRRDVRIRWVSHLILGSA
jgi:hypothetical protein